MVLCLVGAMLFGRATAPTAAPSVAVTTPMVEPPPIVEPEPVLTPGELFAIQYESECARFRALSGDALGAALEDWAADRADTSYAMLERNADAHMGEHVMFSGIVEEIQDVDGGSIARLSTGPYHSQIVWIETENADPHLVARARARAYGYLSGEHTYSSQAGWTITLPSMLAVAVVPASVPAHVSASARERAGL